MTYDSLVNRGDYFSAHYLAEIFPKDLRSGLLAAWKSREEEAKCSDPQNSGQEPDPAALPVTPRLGLRALRRPYFRTRAFFAEAALTHDDATTYDAPEWREHAASLNASVLRALGYDAKPQVLTVSRADHTYEIPVAHAEAGLVAVDCGWAAEPDAALDPEGSGRLLTPVQLDASTVLRTGSKLASFLFASEDAPRYMLLLAGGVIVLADRAAWGEGRYLAASLDTALDRNNTKDGQELDTLAALFGADSLRTPEEGGENPLAGLVDKSTKHAVGVSSELRDGLRESVELIANEVLELITSHEGVRLQDVKELPELSQQLTRESLRYLYRILFLLYAEARPELGILPSDYPEYHQGYGLGRLGELVAERDLVGEKAREGVYLYESLDLLFSKVQEGYRPRRTHGVGAKDSEDIGLRFEPLHSKLFEPESIRLIGAESVKDPRHDDDSDEGPRYLDTRLRNAALYKVLRKLMLTRGRKGERGGFISYAQLGINQLGAVYEGLMSYTGRIADEELYEVAKNGDPKDGSWLIPRSKTEEYADAVFVHHRDEETGENVRVSYLPGKFVYRLSGRDRQTSASYYTPESLTKVTVQLALQHRLDQDDTVTEARELLDWKICEPALGSGAFLNEAINQVAAEYLRRRQDETGRAIDTEQYAVELQKAKAYIALHNSYGVDLNSTAVELAEVSLWLNTMHPGMEAPWFGLHLRRGNSLIGGRREIYGPERLKKGGWLGTTPERFPLAEASSGLPSGSVHHFLLPAKEWGAVAAEKEAKALAPEEAKALGAWRRAITKSPSSKQTARLQGLARRAEYLWQLVVRRLEISERDISRKIDVWGAEPQWLRLPVEAVQREEVLADLEAVDTPYWRLKTLMDAWCALWFWPVQEASLLNGTNPRYRQAAELAEQSAVYEVAVSGVEEDEDAQAGVLMSWEEEALPGFGMETKQLSLTQEDVDKRRMGRRKESVAERRRAVIPLAHLDDWLDFAESLLGTQDVPTESLIAEFESLTELTPYEDALPDLMGMDRSYWLESRFPWTAKSKDIATQQGFFHWELEYAQVFDQGGFDLQVGNPPWVRPTWQEKLVFAELDPWFALTEKPSVSQWQAKRSEALTDLGCAYFITELSSNSALGTFLTSPTTYPLLTGTQPDLYRAFMSRTWQNSSTAGMAGLIHPDSHFTGTREASLRSATYAHLRFHAHFANYRQLFSEIQATRQFSCNIYGQPQEIRFTSASWLLAPETLTASLDHDGSEPLPGIKRNQEWDLRPHRSRLINVDTKLLALWKEMSGEPDQEDSQTPLLYPLTSAEQGAISAIASYSHRVSNHHPQISSGHHEKTAKEDGVITWSPKIPENLEELIIQGPHFGVANPMTKQPRVPCRSIQDWDSLPPLEADPDLIPRTNYSRACSEESYRAAQDIWNGRLSTEHFRLAWREMIPFNGERSLYATLLPPGPSHVNAVHTLTATDNRSTAVAAGFWAALPLDYLLRIAGRAHLQIGDAPKMPTGDPRHPLAAPLLIRTLRLNCLTHHYGEIWSELYHPSWPHYEGWAYEWPNASSLSAHLSAKWQPDSPLRTELDRRSALVELDAIVSTWMGISADQLVAIYQARYPVLFGFESEMYFDANGRKIARNYNTYGHGQTKETYPALLDHLDNPATVPPPEGYTAPFYKADRETEMRAAHAFFSARLDAEIAAGRWTPPVKGDA
ncbi:class I SAM-dependent DNA methyltransferase [Streptomyces cyaneofuscatus]|uniref:class I SAM-dependent DNA methyltransferase n=1 Tax=Streptomyces cyaneofuscatus TaxID=66883 RepID=UPI0038266648